MSDERILEPCELKHFTNSLPLSTLSTPLLYSFLPFLFLISDSNLASSDRVLRIIWPDIFFIAASTNRLNVTTTETGFPGNPKNKHLSILPYAKGRPGLTAIFQKFILLAGSIWI